MQVTQDLLRRLFTYDPSTGELIWKEKLYKRSRSRLGEPAGGIDCLSGYRIITIDGKRFRAHRLVWMYHNGNMPEKQVDHINGNRADNRIGNLREATNGQNQANSKPSSKSGLKGVYATKDGKWQAHIKVNKRNRYLGRYDCIAAASIAYQIAADEVHGEFAKRGV